MKAKERLWRILERVIDFDFGLAIRFANSSFFRRLEKIIERRRKEDDGSK